MDGDADRRNAQIVRALEWLAAGGLAWLLGPAGRVVLGGDVLLADDPAVAGLLAQSPRDPAGVERFVRAGGVGYVVRARALRDGWTVGALVPAELDGGMTRGRLERLVPLLLRVLPVSGGGMGSPDGGAGGGGAPAHVAVLVS